MAELALLGLLDLFARFGLLGLRVLLAVRLLPDLLRGLPFCAVFRCGVLPLLADFADEFGELRGLGCEGREPFFGRLAAELVSERCMILS